MRRELQFEQKFPLWGAHILVKYMYTHLGLKRKVTAMKIGSTILMSVSKLEAIHDHVTLKHHSMTGGVGGKLLRSGEYVFGVSVFDNYQK